MYKGASQSLQARHAVDRPHPSRGFIDAPSDARDVLPDPGAMSEQDMADELLRLKGELGRCVHDMTAAKTLRNKTAIASLGQRHMALQARIQQINVRLRPLQQARSDQLFTQAVREVVDKDTYLRIVARKRELEAQVDRNPEGHDPEEGHGAEHESPVLEEDAPDLGSYSSIPLERGGE